MQAQRNAEGQYVGDGTHSMEDERVLTRTLGDPKLSVNLWWFGFQIPFEKEFPRDFPKTCAPATVGAEFMKWAGERFASAKCVVEQMHIFEDMHASVAVTEKDFRRMAKPDCSQIIHRYEDGPGIEGYVQSASTVLSEMGRPLGVFFLMLALSSFRGERTANRDPVSPRSIRLKNGEMSNC